MNTRPSRRDGPLFSRPRPADTAVLMDLIGVVALAAIVVGVLYLLAGFGLVPTGSELLPSPTVPR